VKKETTTPNTVAAYDCSSPTSMQTFGFEERCEKPDMDSAQEPTTITILQRIKEVKFSGYRCHMTKATTRYICGAWSYNKYLPDAIGHVPVPLTGSFCANLIQRKIYKDVRGDRHKVAVPGVTEISLTEKGYEGVDKGDESCLGETPAIHGKIVNRVVQSADRQRPPAL
jgi:hypothetical protein